MLFVNGCRRPQLPGLVTSVKYWQLSYVNSSLPFIVPINRLQWKDGRNMALRGDDLIGFPASKRAAASKRCLKVNLRVGSACTTTQWRKPLQSSASTTADLSPHTLLYLVDRLKDMGQTPTAEVLEDYALLGGKFPITHFIFTLSGNGPANGCANGTFRHLSSGNSASDCRPCNYRSQRLYRRGLRNSKCLRTDCSDWRLVVARQRTTVSPPTAHAGLGT